jgi:hypothetical protein
MHGASSQSSLAIQLANEFGTEINSIAEMMTVNRKMFIFFLPLQTYVKVFAIFQLPTKSNRRTR